MGSRISLIGTFLILVNSVIVAANGSPLVLLSYPVSSVDALLAPNNPLWISIAFGFRGLAQGPLTLIWIVIAAGNFFLAMLWYLRPERSESKSLLVLIFSILSIFTGGGFIIGLILGVIGGSVGLQPRLSFREAFIIKYLRALRLDKALFNDLKKGTTVGVVWMIMLISLLSGFGCSFYMNSLNEIRSSPDAALKILLLGDNIWNDSVLYAAFINIGIGVFKWLFLALIIFLIGTKLMVRNASFDTVMSMISYAYTPIALQIFLPLLHFNEPALSSNWPMAMFFITNLWMILALVIGTGQLFEIPMKKAVGMMILGGTIYWIGIYKVIFPILKSVEPSFEVPGIFFEIQPISIVLILVSVSAILSVLLGVFSKQK
jgi:hypothetical protein